MSNKFVLSGFSDEVDFDIKKQFEALKKLGINYFEPRMINEKNIIKLSDDEVNSLKELMKEYGIPAAFCACACSRAMAAFTSCKYRYTFPSQSIRN